MGSDTKAKFGFTTRITLTASITNGVYGQVSALPTSNAELPGVYGQVSALPTSNAELPGVYGQVSPMPTSNAEAPTVYGQTTPIILLGLDQGTVYGQVSMIRTLGVDEPVVYGQVVALSGFGSITLTTSIPGVGDIIYYGDAADLNLDSGEFLAAFDNQVSMSGMAAPVANYNSLATQDSNSIIFAASGVSVLPSPEAGIYFFFSNHNGLSLSVSGINQIRTSNGVSNTVSVSGVGSHLGLIGTGSEWIAIEESGVI
jgi:hypothetical protein